MRFLSSIGLAALLASSCLSGAAHANTLDFAVNPTATTTYTGSTLDTSTALILGSGTLLVGTVGLTDQSGLTAFSSTITISPLTLTYGSTTGVQSTPLATDITKSWSDTLGNFTETLTTIDYIGRGAPNAIVVILEGLLTNPDLTTTQVFFELNANQVGGPGHSVNWSGTQSTTNPNPVPLPAAFPLFATGLGALGLLGWRRKRKPLAAA
jgi:hypothetical protein